LVIYYETEEDFNYFKFRPENETTFKNLTVQYEYSEADVTADDVEGARQSTELYFGIPTFGVKDENDEQEENQKDLGKP
jgi:hypothetical protein